jgi:hypothetical protein
MTQYPLVRQIGPWYIGLRCYDPMEIKVAGSWESHGKYTKV